MPPKAIASSALVIRRSFRRLILKAPDGAVIDTIDALATGGVVDLSPIPTTYPTISIEASIDPSTGYDPWALAVGPAITATVNDSDIPTLVE